MDAQKKTFTTLEAEFLAGYVYGCTLDALGVVKDRTKMTDEQELLLWKFIDAGMQALGQKSSLQQQAEEELQRMIDGEAA